MAYLIRSRLAGKLDTGAERSEAEAWCSQHSVSTEAALRNLTGLIQFGSLKELFPAEMQFALKQEKLNPGLGGAGNLELLYHLCEHIKAEKVIETGVAYGWSSLAILLSMQNRKKGSLISIDLPYLQRNTEQSVGCVVSEELKRYWTLMKCSDRMGLDKAIRNLGTIDLCHYDSDKNYHGRMWAYPRLWKALRKGGIFLSDDIGDNFAFRDFMNSFQINFTIIKQRIGNQWKYVGLATKP